MYHGNHSFLRNLGEVVLQKKKKKIPGMAASCTLLVELVFFNKNLVMKIYTPVTRNSQEFTSYFSSIEDTIEKAKSLGLFISVGKRSLFIMKYLF